MAEYTLTDFDKYKVEQGASLGTKIDDKIVLSTCINIYPLGTNMYMGYVIFNNNLYQLFYFDSDGNLYNLNKTKVGVAYIVDSNITKTTGTKLVRETSSDGTSNARPFPRYGIATASETGGTEESGKEEEIFSIATLQPREEVAASCLQSMLQKYENPLNIDNTKIKQLVSKSFLFAQEFINQAVLYREKETTSATVENNKYASVDSDSLSSDTDKLLYNIATAINNFIAQDKNQYADQQKNGLKLAATDVNVKTLPESININAAVTGSVTTKQESTSSGT
ncbi:hypothetical protein NND09_05530 [Prevotella copri]|uniref:Uncharacterized protein n=1 Tax=Segatella copri TaxID=165179 RepID=A0AAW4YJN8_9BACT|nr:hypothetical protein [Segatella copri]MCE4121659.1 hypothetical protein [Segatella copri]MCP9498026.1 hypothetical protein [Segatella copri]MCP9512965.1 hypothetical protein [Segatella copri]MCP9521948.1 hypothetical protein [Segatella copri]